MEIISIEKKTFEELVARLGQFVKRMDSINRQMGGKFSIVKAILNEYCKVAIVAGFNFTPDRV